MFPKHADTAGVVISNDAIRAFGGTPMGGGATRIGEPRRVSGISRKIQDSTATGPNRQRTLPTAPASGVTRTNPQFNPTLQTGTGRITGAGGA